MAFPSKRYFHGFTSVAAIVVMAPPPGNYSQIREKLVGTQVPQHYSLFLQSKLVEKAKNMGYPAPAYKSVVRASKILEKLKSERIEPSFVNPCEEGGVMIEFKKDAAYFNVEVFNSEEILLLKSNGASRIISDLPWDAFLPEFESALS